MKITKRQLRRIIREATNISTGQKTDFGSNSYRQSKMNESYMSRLFSEIQNWVLSFNQTGVVHVDDLIAAWKKDYPDIGIDQLWGVMDIMEEGGDLSLEGSSGYYRFS